MSEHKHNVNDGKEDMSESIDIKDAQTEATSLDNSKLEARISALEEELVEANNKFLRAKAETDNVKRIAKREVEDTARYSIEKLARELLAVYDGLEKGLNFIDPANIPDEAKAIFEGMQLTEKMLVDTLANHGIKLIDPINQKFDPSLHEALMMQPVADAEPDTVIQVIQKGFKIFDRVLRPARVIVASPLKNSQ